MNWIHLILLGVVQGLTEFLPVSSDGHLALTEMFLGIKEDNLAITVALHAGTLLATLVYFRNDLIRLLVALPKMAAGTSGERRLLIALIAGSVPTAIIGLLLKHPTEALSTSLWAIGGFLILSGAWDYVVVVVSKRGGATRSIDELRLTDALAVGVVQGLAVLPGLSRSASTLGMGTVLGLSREAAARYSFLLSLPAVGGALLLEAKDISGLQTGELGPVALGVVVSFSVGICALAILFRVLKSGRFDVFAFYCWALALAVLAAAWHAGAPPVGTARDLGALYQEGAALQERHTAAGYQRAIALYDEIEASERAGSVLRENAASARTEALQALEDLAAPLRASARESRAQGNLPDARKYLRMAAAVNPYDSDIREDLAGSGDVPQGTTPEPATSPRG